MLWKVVLFCWNFFFPSKITLVKKRIIIAKVNQIGDVTFSLPLASAIKRAEPTATIIFLGRGYTKELIEAYGDVDEFANWDELKHTGLSGLKADIILNITQDTMTYQAGCTAGIPVRIGTLRKKATWLTCTHWVNFSRNNSLLHETQLDMKFLKPLGLKWEYTLPEIVSLRNFKPIRRTSPFLELLSSSKFNLILHPKTRGNHQEWPVEHFQALINRLPKERYNIFITGSTEEGTHRFNDSVHNLTGKTSLNDLVELIAYADGLIAASTGPVHLAANLNKWTLGLYTQRKPQYACRWGPIGNHKVMVRTAPMYCIYCKKNRMDICECLSSILPDEVFKVIDSWTIEPLKP